MLRAFIARSPRSAAGPALRYFWAATEVPEVVFDAPGDDPLDQMRHDCIRHKLCDEAGFRKKDVHWTFSLAVGSTDPKKPPSLRTIGFQRVSTLGIDFVIKRGSDSSQSLAAGQAASIVALHGRYLAGENSEQWRAEGYCEELPLEEIIDVVPHSTLTNIVACKRIHDEEGKTEGRVSIEGASHLTDLIQQARLQLDIQSLSSDVLSESVVVCGSTLCRYTFPHFLH